MPKLRPPRPPSSFVARERLLSQLDSGLERKLTLFSAPAGFGKTMLVSQWATNRINEGSDPHHLLPVAWISLDSGDNDPVRFWAISSLLARCFRLT